MQGAYRLQVSQAASFNELEWDTGKVASEQSVHVVYGGEGLEPMTRYYWRVMVWDQEGRETAWSEPAYWETGIMTPEAWTAEWITAASPSDSSQSEPATLLRKGFELHDEVASARIYASALGLYELELNGSRVGDWLFTPGFTSYKHRLQYQTYDVTDLLLNGSNAIGATLSDGWYKGNLAWMNQRNIFGDRRALLAELHVRYADGREDVIRTDSTWRAGQGPIRMSEIYHGETYDAGLELNGWSEPGFDDSEWGGTVSVDYSKQILVAQENVPTRVVQELAPVSLIHTPAGETVLDFGQNMVGWVRFTVDAAKGTVITLQHAEVLDKEGNFFTGNLRSAKQKIEYTCKGGGPETYEPHFTFQGFRYVMVEGWPGEMDLSSFTGRVIYSDMKPTGTFECSDSLINKLQENIVWGQKGNFLDIPTDCPQRDERLGWTGDAQVFIRTAAYQMDVAAFFTKWLRDLKADQREDGGVHHVIPNALDNDWHSSAGWADAAVICPWTIYLCYGDKRILEEQYESMKAWIGYMRSQGENEYLWNTGSHFGDWLGLDAKENSYMGATPTDYIATAYYAYSAGLVARTAEVLGKAEDAKVYQELRGKVIEHFHKEFITPNGRIASPTQTAHVLALFFDLVEGEVKDRTVRTLVKLIEDNGFKLSTGFLGTPYICHVLTANGHHEVAAKLVQQKEYPSWLYPVTQGATTIWEHWDSIKPDGSFWSNDMNSFNHYAYGAVGDWLYRVIGGIDTSEADPGYKRIILKPHFMEGLTHAKAAFDSMYGEIRCGWSLEEEKVQVEIAIPANTRAGCGASTSEAGWLAGRWGRGNLRFLRRCLPNGERCPV